MAMAGKGPDTHRASATGLAKFSSSGSEVEAIKVFANHLEPIELGGGGAKQLGLFRGGSQQEQS